MMQPALTANKRRYRPTQLRGCVLWLDAARIPAGAVASTPNLGTLGGAFEQSTSGARPTCTAGAGPRGNALVFDGGDYLSSSLAASNWSFLHSQNFTLYVVFRSTSNTSTAFGPLLATYDGTVTNTGAIVGWDNRSAVSRDDSLGFSMSRGSSPYVYSTGTPNGTSPFNTWQLAEVVHSYGASGSDLIVTINGTAQLGVEPGAVPSSGAPIATLHIGALAGGILPLVGGIAEMFTFNRTLSTAERSWCRSYVRAKHLLSGS